MPGNFEKELQIKFHEIALPTPWVIQYSYYSKRVKLNVLEQGIVIVTVGNVFLAGMSSHHWSKRYLTPPHIGRSVYLHIYPRHSLHRRGQKKERDERENYTSNVA